MNPADFRITTFVSGLNYPDAMMTLSDGSMLVGVSNAGGSAGYGNSTGELLRFADNGIDGNNFGNEAWSADELDRIPAAQIGGPVEYFGFPEVIGRQLTECYVSSSHSARIAAWPLARTPESSVRR